MMAPASLTMCVFFIDFVASGTVPSILAILRLMIALTLAPIIPVINWLVRFITIILIILIILILIILIIFIVIIVFTTIIGISAGVRGSQSETGYSWRGFTRPFFRSVDGWHLLLHAVEVFDENLAKVRFLACTSRHTSGTARHTSGTSRHTSGTARDASCSNSSIEIAGSSLPPFPQESLDIEMLPISRSNGSNKSSSSALAQV
jgi:hypothetical protein